MTWSASIGDTCVSIVRVAARLLVLTVGLMVGVFAVWFTACALLELRELLNTWVFN